MTSGNPHRNRRNGDIIRTMILHLHLVRHGQTYFNRYNRLQGWSNSPLTESGVADAVKAGERLKGLTFAAAYCSDTTRAQQTAEKILDINEAAGNPRPALVTDMHFREQFYGYYEGLDMAMAWYAAGAPHGVKTYNQIVEKFGLGASRDFLKEADPFHDAESDEEYWTRVEGAFRLIGNRDRLRHRQAVRRSRDHRFVRQVANSKQYISNSTYGPRRHAANESVSRTAFRL